MDRALALGAHLPAGAFYSGSTAAALWGLPLPLTGDERLEVMRWNTQAAIRQSGLRCARITPHRLHVTELRGVPVTDPASTWLSLASRLGLRDLVALGDAAIREARIPGTQYLDRPPLARPSDLQGVVADGRYIGISKARTALPLLSPRSASAPESHLRLLIREWGLPEPELDYDVCDQHGRLIGCSEFAWPEYRLAAEYEGEHHLTDPRQWNRDIEKYRGYASLGWEPLRVTARLLYRQQVKLRRDLVEALRRRGWRG